MNTRHAAFGALVALVMGSALGVVYAKYESRKQFVDLQELVKKRDAMTVEWGRLLLEQSTLASHSRVETLARTRLGMIMPPPGDVVIVKP